MRECLVDIDCGDDGIESIREKTVMAKRQFSCVECECEIPSGHPFRLEVGRDREGAYTVNTTCPTCYELRERFCCSWYYGMVLEDICEALYENNGEMELGCLDGLSVDARDFIIEALEAAWEEAE